MSEDKELPQLTDKQYKFVEGKAKGLSNAEAYRQAYNSKSTKPESIWRRAAEVASNSKVTAWLEYLRQEATSKLLDETHYTLEAHMAELDAVLKLAVENKSYGPALQAIVSKGKACNHYTEHKQINVNNQADLALVDRLETLLGKPAAEAARQSLGYEDTKH